MLVLQINVWSLTIYMYVLYMYVCFVHVYIHCTFHSPWDDILVRYVCMLSQYRVITNISCTGVICFVPKEPSTRDVVRLKEREYLLCLGMHEYFRLYCALFPHISVIFSFHKYYLFTNCISTVWYLLRYCTL